MVYYTTDNASLKAPATHVQRSTLVLICFAVYLVGAHLRLSLYTGSGNILLPMYLMLLGTAGMGLLFVKPLLRNLGPTFALLVVFALIQPFLSTAPGTGFSVGVIQFLVSVASALVVLQALGTVAPDRLRRLLLRAWGLLILLAFLESVALKPVFDVIRDTIYSGSGRFVYFETARDLEIYSRVRSTAFASEPSFLADSLSAIMLMIFFLDPNRGSLRSYALLGAMVVISFTLSPSFKMASYLLALAVWQIWPRQPTKLAVLLIGMSLMALGGTLFYEPLLAIYTAVAGSHMVTGSYFGRITVAPEVGLRALEISPLFGYGIGNDEAVYPLVEQAWVDAGALLRFFWFQGSSATDMMSNGFWWQWIFLGLAGLPIFLGLVIRMLHKLRVESPFRTIICAWIVWYSGFAFVDPHSWFIFMIFALGARQIPSRA